MEETLPVCGNRLHCYPLDARPFLGAGILELQESMEDIATP